MKSDYFNLIESKLNGKKKILVKHKHKKTGGVRTITDPSTAPPSTEKPVIPKQSLNAADENAQVPQFQESRKTASLPSTQRVGNVRREVTRRDASLPSARVPPARPISLPSARVPPARPISLPSARVPPARPISLLPARVPPARPISLLPARVPPTRRAASLPSARVPPPRPISLLPARVPPTRPISLPPTHVSPASPSVRPSLDESAKKKSTKKVKFGKNRLKIGESVKNAYEKIKQSLKKNPFNNSEIQSDNSRIISNNSEIRSNDIQSPSYPYKLQVIPRHRNTEKKTSEAFDLHLEKIQKKIDDTSEKIDNQSKYVAEEQRILDKKKENLYDWDITSSLQRKERIWNIIKFIVSTVITIVSMIFSILVSIVKWIVDRIMSTIRWALLILVKFLNAIQPILWAIMAIICVFILIILIAWLIRGGRFELGINNYGKNSGSDIDIDLQIKSDDSLKVSSSKNYGSSVTIPPWNWNNFIISPINYTINYTLATTLNKINNYIDIPEVLNKVRIQNPIYTLRKNFKLLNNDNLKIDRIQNDKQREDNISFINYKLIDENIANEFCQVKEKQNKYHSISLIKPKNIEWELPHLDYTNTDMSKLPESIKNYKNSNNPNSLSLNEQSKIIFPWKYNNDKWTLDCKTKFINNEFTGLYEDNGDGNCKATLQPATKHPP